VLLALDVGNTQTVLGLYQGKELRDHWRIATEPQRTGDELAVLLEGLLEDVEAVEGVSLASSVPVLVAAYSQLAARWLEVPIVVVGPGVKTSIAFRYDDPREVGPDRIANSLAARERYGAPAIVVDFGTSTNYDVDVPAWAFVGGVVAPGIEVSMAALTARAARLFSVDFTTPPTVISKSTVGALQSGLVYGFTGQVDEIVTRIRGELGVDAPVVATGGLAELIAPHSRTIGRVDPWHTLEGLRLVWELNR
jgi:type III pantothenate kinase